MDVGATSACLASVRSCAERPSIASGKGCAAGGGLGHRSAGAESIGDDVGGSVGAGDVGDVAEASVGVGLVSVGDGSEVGHASVGEGSAVGLGSAGEGVGVWLGSVVDGVGVGVGSVGEGSMEGGGLSVGAQVSVRGEGVCVDVGSICATARPPRADPKATEAASTARTQARSLTAVARRRAAVT